MSNLSIVLWNFQAVGRQQGTTRSNRKRAVYEVARRCVMMGRRGYLLTGERARPRLCSSMQMIAVAGTLRNMPMQPTADLTSSESTGL